MIEKGCVKKLDGLILLEGKDLLYQRMRGLEVFKLLASAGRLGRMFFGEKRLKGKVTRDAKGKLSSVQITDSAENIRSYIEKEDPEKLFHILSSYRKAGK